MRLFATGNTEADSAGAVSKEHGSESWLKGHKCMVALAVIMILGLALRLIFSYGISAGSNYALSGGTDASSHLRIVLEILTGTYDPASQSQLNYPYGIKSSSGPFYDYLMAGFAYIVTLFGVSNATAASGVMAWTAPIFGVLTAVPVFMIAKKLTGDDQTISLLAAFIYVFTALVISVTPFSYGAEYALLGFLAAFMVYFLVCAIKSVDDRELTGVKSVLDRQVLIYTVIAGILFGLVTQTWIGFRAIVIAAGVILAIHLIVSRINGRDIGASVGISTVFLLIGIVIGAAYYIPFGLWSNVFSGGCVLALLIVVFSVAFLALEKKPWVISVPVTLVAIVIVAVVIALCFPDLSHDITHGNSPYEAGLVKDMAETFSRSSISSMAAWFGWVTVWMPLALGAYMLYRYRRDGGKRLYDFTALWMLAMFFMSWFSSEYAILAAAAMSIGISVVIVRVVRYVDVRSYFHSLKGLRGNGAKAAAKKIFNFFPFVTVVVVALLVVAPNAVNAFDASTPTNDEKADYFGGLGYTINTSDSSLVNSTWSYYNSESKDGALLSWYGYSDPAVVFGGFNSVTSSNGDGSSAMSVALLQNGSTGALVSMTVRLLQNNTDKVESVVSSAGMHSTAVSASDLKDILSSPSKAQAAIDKYDSDLADLNLDDSLRTYYGAYAYLVDGCHLSDSDLCKLYDSACAKTGNRISYIELDTSMLPIYYGDSSAFSSVAYLGGYDVDDYGAATDFYYISSYTNYAYYYDAMYTTFVYQGLIGITPDQAGESYSLSLLSDLSLSDGTVKATPGAGINGFVIDYWHVMYNPDPDATGSSSGWVDKDITEALKLQKSEGGLINYLASVVVYKYVGMDNALTGTITTADGSALAGVTVNVYSVDDDGVRTLEGSTVSGSDGYYSVNVDKDGHSHVVVYSTSATEIREDGNVIETVSYAAGASGLEKSIQVGLAYIDDARLVTSDGATYVFDGIIQLTDASGNVLDKTYEVTDGVFDIDGVAPGTYTVSVYARNSDRGATVTTGTLTAVSGNVYGTTVEITAYTLTVTVTDQYLGTAVQGANVSFVDTSTGDVVTTVATDKDGKAAPYLVAGTYSYFIADSSYVSVSTTTTTVSSSSTTGTLTAYPAAEISVTGAPAGAAVTVVAQSFRTVTTDGTVSVPVSLGLKSTYFAYCVSGGSLYAGSGASAIAMTKVDSITVSGTVKASDGSIVSGATVAFDNVDWYAVVTTGTDGKYSVTLPAGEYTMCATDSSSNVCYDKVSASSDSKDVTLKTGTADYLTMYYYTGMSSGSTKTVAFLTDFTASFLNGEDTVTLYHLQSDVSGKVNVTVVKGDTSVTVTYTVKYTENDVVYIGKHTDVSGSDPAKDEDVTVETTGTTTFYIQRTEPSSASSSYGTSHMKTRVVSNLEFDGSGVTGQLTCYSSSSTTYKVENGVVNGGEAIVPGQYTFKTGTWDGDTFTAGISADCLYYDAYVYLRTGETSFDWASEPFNAFKVTLTTSDGDTVTVTCDDEKSEYKEAEAGKLYYCKAGFTYRFKAVDSEGKVAYADACTNAGAEVSIDMTTKAKTVSVSGNVPAADAEGKITVTDSDGLAFKAEVSEGAYSISLPVGKTYTFTVSGDELKYTNSDLNLVYAYALEGTWQKEIAADATDGITFNLGATVGSCTHDDVSVTVDDDKTTVDANGNAVVCVTIKNDTENTTTYLIDGSDGLILDKTYSVTVPAKSTYTAKDIKGVLAAGYGAGMSDVAINVTTTDGTAVGTDPLGCECFKSSTDGKVTLAVAGEDVSDAVNGYSYRYAFQFKNDNTYAVAVTLKGTISGTSDGWHVYYSDDSDYVVADGKSIYVFGKSTETLYIVLLNDGKVEYSSVPSIKYEVSAATLSGDSVTIDGADASGELSKGVVKVEQSSASVSNGGAVNEAQKISTVFYGLIVLFVILFLVFLWIASKKGAISRR